MEHSCTVVTVATFNTVMEAELAKTMLQAEGIEAFVADAHTISVNPLYSNALGGVKIQVAARDLEQARILLIREPTAESLNEDLSTCPRCGDPLQVKEKGRWGVLLATFLAGIPLAIRKKTRTCPRCNK